MELPNIAAYAYQDVHVWSALLTCLRPQRGRPRGPKIARKGQGWAYGRGDGEPGNVARTSATAAAGPPHVICFAGHVQ